MSTSTCNREKCVASAINKTLPHTLNKLPTAPDRCAEVTKIPQRSKQAANCIEEMSQIVLQIQTNELTYLHKYYAA